MSNRREGDNLLGAKGPSVNDDGVSMLSPQLRESDPPYHDLDVGEQAIPLMELDSSTGKQPQTPGTMASSFELTQKGFDSEVETPGWMPKTLRLPYMLFLISLTFGLGIIVLAITIRSQKNQGLGLDQDTSIFLFGWRFSPTLIAVIWQLLLMSMVGEIKRTEVFARLSRPNPASPESTLFYKPRMFWFDPIDSLSRRKNEGLLNMPLLWASLINIFGLLIISPFSAALLSPAQVLVGRDTTFSRLSPNINGPLKLQTDDFIFFRTISSVLLNTTTSAWLNNEFAVLPFWPSEQEVVPLGAVLSTEARLWTANTTVYQAALDCQVMEMTRMSNFSFTISRKAPNSNFTAVKNSTMTSFLLESQDGCQLGYATYADGSVWQPTDSMWKSGGGWWASGNYSYPLLSGIGNGTYDGVTSDNPLLLNSTTQCGDRSLFFMTTPYVKDQIFDAQGHICKSSYSQAKILVTVSNTGSSSSIKFNTKDFEKNKTPFNSDVVDIATFEDSFLSQNWTTKFQPPDSTSNPTLPLRPQIGGPLILVGAQNNFNTQAMIENPNITDQARVVKQRFLGESMRSALEGISAQDAETISGRISESEQRIVVSLVIGCILAVILIGSSVMLVLVMIETRLSKRPLNLVQRPTAISAVASMVASEPATRAVFQGLDRSSDEAMRRTLEGYLFSLRNGILYTHKAERHDQFSSSDFEFSSQNTESRDWRPQVLRGWPLIGLLACLTAMVVALAVMFSKFRVSGIYQSFLVSSFDVNFVHTSVEALSPYSIIPTLVAVGIKLWWTSVDETFRRLQPYVAMAHHSGQSPKIATLSYMSSPLGWTALKASKYKHWLLVLVASSAVLLEVFTVGMSALWDKNPGVRSRNMTSIRNFELRTVPAIFSVSPPSAHGYSSTIESQNLRGVLSSVYGNLLTGWMYSGVVEKTYNSTASPWTSEDWAFVPVQLDGIKAKKQSESSTADASLLGAANNVTVDTPSLRGRLECTQFDMSTNTSAWLTTLDFTNKTAWNWTDIPADLKVGYELNLGLAMNQTFNGTSKYWSQTNPYFSFFSANYRMKCCGNGTNEDPGEAVIGYWSSPADSTHNGIVVKWITGHPFPAQFNTSLKPNQIISGEGYGSPYHWVWKDVPKVTALNCTPIFETANSSVTVDLATGIVQDYKILEPPKLEPNAWTYNYLKLNVSTGVNYSTTAYVGSGAKINGGYVSNVTVSYGYLFHDALIGAAMTSDVGSNVMGVTTSAESLEDHTFNFRLPGQNLDFMSYAALNMVNNNKYALLDPKTLGDVSSTVFSNFFKHFVHGSANSSAGLYVNGTWGLQPLNAVVPQDLGKTEEVYGGEKGYYLQNVTKASDTKPDVGVILSSRVDQLDLSPVAVILCLSILGFLLLTTMIVLATWRRKGVLDALPRDVDTLGSVIGFVYASEGLLQLASSSTKDIKRENGRGEVFMGWFVSGGKRRWGVELLEGEEGKMEKLGNVVEIRSEGRSGGQYGPVGNGEGGFI